MTCHDFQHLVQHKRPHVCTGAERAAVAKHYMLCEGCARFMDLYIVLMEPETRPVEEQIRAGIAAAIQLELDLADPENR